MLEDFRTFYLFMQHDVWQNTSPELDYDLVYELHNFVKKRLITHQDSSAILYLNYSFCYQVGEFGRQTINWWRFLYKSGTFHSGSNKHVYKYLSFRTIHFFIGNASSFNRECSSRYVNYFAKESHDATLHKVLQTSERRRHYRINQK